MNILLIQACAESIKKSAGNRLSAKLGILPPSVILRIAAITPKKHNIAVIDDTYQKINYNGHYNVVGITAITMTAPRAYKIADEFRRRGVKVVLGGWHPSAMPEEAKQHADAIVIGEAEDTWPKLLEDIEKNKLQPFYRPEKPFDMRYIPPYKQHMGIRIVFTPTHFQVTRGCSVGCEFCAITNQIYGNVHRTMSIEDAIKTLKAIPQKALSSSDPSMTLNTKYSKELFIAMKPLKKKFAVFGNVNILNKDDELLRLSKEAGCVAWSMGLESISQDSIDLVRKKSNKVNEYSSAIKKIHNHGMAVVGSFILGIDGDTTDIFDATLNTAKELELDAAHFYICTPFPGTPLFNKLDKEGRIFSKDWERYDLFHCVFKPKNMTPEELTEGAKQIAKEFHTISNITKRLMRCAKLGIYPFLGLYQFNTSSRQMYKNAFEYAFKY